MQKIHGALKFEATPSEVQGSLFTDIARIAKFAGVESGGSVSMDRSDAGLVSVSIPVSVESQREDASKGVLTQFASQVSDLLSATGTITKDDGSPVAREAHIDFA